MKERSKQHPYPSLPLACLPSSVVIVELREPSTCTVYEVGAAGGERTDEAKGIDRKLRRKEGEIK